MRSESVALKGITISEADDGSSNASVSFIAQDGQSGEKQLMCARMQEFIERTSFQTDYVTYGCDYDCEDDLGCRGGGCEVEREIWK